MSRAVDLSDVLTNGVLHCKYLHKCLRLVRDLISLNMHWKHLTLIGSLICGVLCETVVVEPENVNGTVTVAVNATRKTKKSVKLRPKDLAQTSGSLAQSGEVSVLEELESYDYSNYDEGKHGRQIKSRVQEQLSLFF